MVGEEKGRRKGGKKRVVEEEVPTYVTTELAVRCLRSRRCLLIYWRDSFRRRAAFRKWRRLRLAPPPPMANFLVTCNPEPVTETKGEDRNERGREGRRERSSLIFISDRCVGRSGKGRTESRLELSPG